MGNALNLGGLSAPAPSFHELAKLFAAKKYAEAYYYLGEARRREGQNDKAVAAYRKALELRPDYAEAAKALAGMK